jgi:hypothetical protein
MKETQEGKIKSSGSLIQTQADGFENAKVTVEEVPGGDLAFDNAIPDYKDETSFPMFIAVKAAGDSRYHVSGWHNKRAPKTAVKSVPPWE